jgi:hypothetical protein
MQQMYYSFLIKNTQEEQFFYTDITYSANGNVVWKEDTEKLK